jgi:DNA mismatch repair ATPase MutS
MNQLEILKQNKEKYLRQKNIAFSELEKLQLDEKVIQKELEITQFIQDRLEEKKKYQVRIEELNELYDLLDRSIDEDAPLTIKEGGIIKLKDLQKIISETQSPQEAKRLNEISPGEETSP